MNINRQILFSGFIIIGTGILNAIQGKNDYTRVLVGGYIYLLMLSILDIFGGNFSRIAGGLALLGSTYVLIFLFPWDSIINMVKGK